MANFVTALMVKAQPKLKDAFQSSELRFRDPSVHKLFLQNTSIMMPDYESLRTREDRVVETNYFIRTARALTAARTHNHTGDQGDSATLTPTWSTKADEFVSTMKEADASIYSFEELHTSKLLNSIANFAEGLETVAASTLFANRSGVNIATAEGTFDGVDDTFEIVDATNGSRAIQITKTTMDVNKYQKMRFTMVCDSIAWNKFESLAVQGTMNATNTAFQFDGVSFVHDPSLTAAAAGLVSAYAKGFWIAVPEGTIAALPWIPKQNREGKDTKVNSYGNMMNPIDNVQYAIHSYELRADGTSKGGYTQDVVEETQISLDIAYEVAPLSVATETPLMAFALT